MNPISRFVKKLSMLIGRKRFGSELDEEMLFHREEAENPQVDLNQRGLDRCCRLLSSGHRHPRSRRY